MYDPTDLITQIDAEARGVPRRGLTPGMLVVVMGVLALIIVIGVMFLRVQQGQPDSGLAPDFTLTTYDGQTITLSDLRGQIVIVNFWASWCGPCRQEAPTLENIWRRYRDRGVTLIGITYADEDDNARAFIDEYDLTYPIGPDRGTTISGDLYNIRGVPETFIIDQTGHVRQFILSVVTDEQLTGAIETLLAEGAS